MNQFLLSCFCWFKPTVKAVETDSKSENQSGEKPFLGPWFSLPHLVTDVIKTLNFKDLEPTQKLPIDEKRVIVFHGGFLDDTNSHPKKLHKLWKENGVDESKMVLMPNCYKEMKQPFIVDEANENEEVLQPVSLFHRVVNGVKQLANKVYNWFAKTFNAATYNVEYGSAVKTCLEQYKELNDDKAKQSIERAEKLDKILKAKGFTKENPAEVSFVGHSGAGAVGATLSSITNKPENPYCYKVVELTTLGSPMTESFLEKIPKEVEFNYVMSCKDDLHKDVLKATSSLLEVRRLVYGKEGEAHYKVAEDVSPFLQKDDQVYQSKNRCHRSYDEDCEALKAIIPDTLTNKESKPLEQLK